MMTYIASVVFALVLLIAIPSENAAQCVGDCDDTGEVTVPDLVAAVQVSLGAADLSSCVSADENGDGAVTIDELLVAVDNALDGCRPTFTPDKCRTAPSIVPDPVDAISANATRATVEPSDPQTSCGCASDSHTLWFRFTPAASGTAHVSTAGSSYATVLALFTGTCGALKELQCNDDGNGSQSQISVAVTQGMPYLIEVSARCDATAGQLRLAISVCGDGIVTGEEDCDDGNQASGDGCDSTCHFEGLSGIDQSWTGRSGPCGSSSGELAIQYAEPIGREFTPTRPLLGAVDVLIDNDYAQPPTTLVMRLRKASITAMPLASASVDLSRTARSWVHFALPSPVAVVPGKIYVIELATDNERLLWGHARGEVSDTCPPPDYTGGRGIAFATPMANLNFLFRTYAGSPSP